MTTWLEPHTARIRKGDRVRVDCALLGRVEGFTTMQTWVSRRMLRRTLVVVLLDNGLRWHVTPDRIETQQPRGSRSEAFPQPSPSMSSTQEG